MRVQLELLLQQESPSTDERLLLVDGNVDVYGGKRVEQRDTLRSPQLLQFVGDPREFFLFVFGKHDLLLLELLPEGLQLRLAHGLGGVAGRLLACRPLRQLAVVLRLRRVLYVELVEDPDELGVVQLTQVAQVSRPRLDALDQLRLAHLVLRQNTVNYIKGSSYILQYPGALLLYFPCLVDMFN